MFSDLTGFEWDVHNVGHIAEHDVTPQEIEETVGRPHVIIASASGGREKRWKLFGRTGAGRYLIRRGKFRTVTAYTMNQAERRIYAPQIER